MCQFDSIYTHTHITGYAFLYGRRWTTSAVWRIPIGTYIFCTSFIMGLPKCVLTVLLCWRLEVPSHWWTAIPVSRFLPVFCNFADSCRFLGDGSYSQLVKCCRHSSWRQLSGLCMEFLYPAFCLSTLKAVLNNLIVQKFGEILELWSAPAIK